MSRLHWIDVPAKGRIAIMARPRAEDWLDTEIAGWLASGVDVVVSLLEPEEVSELGLQREAALCRAAGLAFVTFPIADRAVPGSRHAAAHLAGVLAGRLRDGRSIAIHYRAGIGRASVVAACVLVCAGAAADDALARISDARGLVVPDTEAQRDWVLAFGEAYRDGTLPSPPVDRWLS